LIPLDEIRAARERLGDTVLRTPLVQLDERVWLKLENLQPIGSFKLRGALNAMRAQPAQDVVTASAGNMAQGVAWAARELGVRATVVAPEHAPRAKLDAVERLGAHVVLVPHEVWWQTMVDRRYEGLDGLFVHPVEDELVMAGNGTIGLELLEQLSDFDTVAVPYGGGGLLTGIASAVKQARPDVKFFAVEPETGAPATATLRAGTPTAVEYTPSFVDGSGSRELIPRVWEQASQLLDGAVAMSIQDVADAVRLIAERTRVIAEGAGALAAAAALGGHLDGAKKAVCIVSGGNIDPAVLSRILIGEQP
jgi:threonine dehydratase